MRAGGGGMRRGLREERAQGEQLLQSKMSLLAVPTAPQLTQTQRHILPASKQRHGPCTCGDPACAASTCRMAAMTSSAGTFFVRHARRSTSRGAVTSADADTVLLLLLAAATRRAASRRRCGSGAARREAAAAAATLGLQLVVRALPATRTGVLHAAIALIACFLAESWRGWRDTRGVKPIGRQKLIAMLVSFVQERRE